MKALVCICMYIYRERGLVMFIIKKKQEEKIIASLSRLLQRDNEKNREGLI